MEIDEFGDQGGFKGVEGVEVLAHAGGEGLIFGGIFAGQEDGLRRQSVFEGVEGGGGFAFFGARSGGVLCVGLIGRVACF